MESSTAINSYTPLDLNAIPRSKINSDKELETEICKLCEVLRDTQSQDWKKRLENMKRVQEISLIYLDIVEGRSAINGNCYLTLLTKLFNPMTSQALDLRSANAKEAGKTIQILAQVMQDDFESLAMKFATKDSLIKLLHCGQKVLAEIANQSFIAILMNVCAPKLIQRFCEEMKASKNTFVHAKLASYLYLMLENYPYNGVLDKYEPQIEQYLQQSLQAANPEARQFGRKAFLLWQSHAPQQADQLFKILDYAVQRAIYDEKEQLQYNAPQVSKTHASGFQNKAQSFKVQKQPCQFEEPPAEVRRINSQSRTSKIEPPKKNQLNKSATPTKQERKNVMHSPKNQNANVQEQPLTTQQAKLQSLVTNSGVPDKQQTQKQGYSNPFQQAVQQRDNSYMDIDQSLFSFEKVLNKLKSTTWYTKVEGMEELIKHLVELDSEVLLKVFSKEKTFPNIVNHTIAVLKSENITKVVEVFLDFIEFLITTLPEAIINSVSEIIFCLIRHIQSKKESVSTKANEIINIAAEILTAEVLLPHLIGILEEIADDPSQISNKVSALEVLNGLLKEVENMDEYIQYESTVSAIGSILNNHSSLKSIQMPSLGAILLLREQNLRFTLKAILELPHLQFSIVKQLANAYEKTLAKQLFDAQQEPVNSREQQVVVPYSEKSTTATNKSPQSIIDIIKSSDSKQNSNNVLQNQTNFKQQQPQLEKKSQESAAYLKNKENSSFSKPDDRKQIQITTLNQFTPISSIASTSFSHPDTSSQNALDISTSSSYQQNNNNAISQSLINSYQFLLDPKQNSQAKTAALKEIQRLNKLYNQQHDDAWSASFESVVDACFTVLMNSQESQQLKEQVLTTLADIIKKHPRERLCQTSMKVANMQLREKILHSTLQIYVSTLSPTQQTSQTCQSNHFADELLAAVVYKCEMKFIGWMFNILLRKEQTPKTQALLRVFTHRVKAVNSGKIENEFKYENYHQIVESLLSMVEAFSEVINNQNADIRKCCVFCLVEIQNIIGDEFFQAFAEKLNPSQQKLVDIYVKRKQEMIKQEKQGNSNYYNQVTNQ